MKKCIFFSTLHSYRIFDRDADDGNVIIRLVRLGMRLCVADGHGRLHAPADPPEHGVLVVQPRRRHGSDEELIQDSPNIE